MQRTRTQIVFYHPLSVRTADAERWIAFYMAIVRNMIRLSTLVVMLVLGDLACVGHTPCENKVISQAESPNGKYVATVYHRSCANGSGRYTVATIKEARFFEFAPDLTDYIMAVGEFHPISVAWKDSTHLEITTPGLDEQELKQLNGNPPARMWRNINISIAYK